MSERPEDNAPENDNLTNAGDANDAAGQADGAAGTEAGSEGGTATAAPPADGNAELAALTAANADLRDRLVRALAEAENIRRRGLREREDTARYAISNFARDLLNVADNLGRALEAVPAEARAVPGVEPMVAGVELTHRELTSVLERFGIKRFDPAGERFDHNRHEAMFEVPGTGQPSGTVVQVVQSGYMIHDRLLRPARVGVARSDETAQPRVDTKA